MGGSNNFSLSEKVDPKGVDDVYFTAHAFSSTFACTLMFG
jgi:hypothetical protein